MADTPPADQQVINQLKTLTRPGLLEHQSRVRRYDHSYEVYRATSPVNQLAEPWQSKLRVKYGMQVIDTALVNIISGEPRIKVTPRGPEDEVAAKGMQAVLDYFVRQDHLVERRPVFAQSGLIFGVAAAKNHWVYRESTKTQRTFSHDFEGQLVTSQEEVAVVERDGPTFEPLNIYYTFWDPNAPDIDAAQYVSMDFWVSKEELLMNKYDAQSGFGLYHNVNQLLEQGDRGAKQPQQTAQERVLGGSDQKRKGLIHLRETWWRRGGQIWVTVVGNGKVLMRNQRSPYWHGQIPVVIAQPRPDLHEMAGIAETELVDHIQEALHTLQNMTIDNLHMTVMRGVTYREGGVTDPNSIVLKPRFKWPVIDHDDIRPFEIQPLSTDVFSERQRLLGDLQLVTGINPYVSGSSGASAGVDQNTATGVTALQEVASRLLRFKAGQLHYKGYQRSFEQWGAMTQQFLDTKIAVKIIGDHGREEWVEHGPEQVAGNFDYILEGSEESLSRQQEKGDAVQLLNALAPFAQLPGLNWPLILERVGAAYGIKNPEQLFQKAQQPQAAPVNGGSPMAPPNPQQMLGGQPFPSNVQNAIGQ